MEDMIYYYSKIPQFVYMVYVIKKWHGEENKSSGETEKRKYLDLFFMSSSQVNEERDGKKYHPRYNTD